MNKSAVIALFLALSCGASCALDFPEQEPLSLEAIAALDGKALSKDEVASLVSGASVEWIVFAGGGRRWTNDRGGEFWSNRFSTGVGNFNPHYRTGQGKWTVGDDGAFCVRIDYRVQIEDFCWRFFNAGGRVLMNLEPPRPGDTIRFYR